MTAEQPRSIAEARAYVEAARALPERKRQATLAVRARTRSGAA